MLLNGDCLVDLSMPGSSAFNVGLRAFHFCHEAEEQAMHKSLQGCQRFNQATICLQGKASKQDRPVNGNEEVRP